MMATITRGEVPEELTWNLADIYATDDAWEHDFTILADCLKEIEHLDGTLTSAAESLLQALHLRDATCQLVQRLRGYAELRLDEDTTQSRYQAMVARITPLSTRVDAACAFIGAQILSIPSSLLTTWLDESAPLAAYRYELEDLLRRRNHTLDGEREQLLLATSDMAQAPSRIFAILDSADLRLPAITRADGTTAPLTKGNYGVFLQSSQPSERHDAFVGMLQTYQAQQHTRAALLSAHVNQRIFYARQRHYASTLEAALDVDHIPVQVYTNLIATVRNKLTPLQRYLHLRRRVLALDTLHLYDLDAPLLATEESPLPFGQACENLVAAVAPLGSAYTSVLRQGLSQRWIDVMESQGKRGGGHNTRIYGVHPYVLLNYQERVRDGFVLAHELGHSLHAYFTQATQPFQYARYTVFLAEIASSLNEVLLIKYLLAAFPSGPERVAALTHYIARFFSAFFRQTLLADFEMQMHARAEAGEPLTAHFLCDLYRQTLERYFGTAGVVVDDLATWEWARIPHFYYNFYVYQYATGIAAAIALAQAIFAEGAPAVERYLTLLRSGASADSTEILQRAGVDLTMTAPIEAALDAFDETVAQLERELAACGE
jgi:oligoendopeptidase F